MIKRICPVCGESYKAPNKGFARSSPLRSACLDCDRKRMQLKREQDRRVREFIENMRTI